MFRLRDKVQVLAQRFRNLYINVVVNQRLPNETLDINAAKERSLSQEISELQPLPDVYFGSD